jgi:hypothetical protein
VGMGLQSRFGRAESSEPRILDGYLNLGKRH